MTLPRTVLASLALIAWPGIASAQAQFALPPAISVIGEATIAVTPDLATVDAGVTTEAKTAKEASEANNKAMGTVLLALKGLDVADKDVRTSRLSLFPQSAPIRQNGPMQITGYRATNHVTVTVHDVSRVAPTIDALVAAGANDIGNIGFAVSETSKLMDDARVKALADAQRKADIYARAAGVSLGAPLSISEDGGAAPSPLVFAKAAMRMDAAPTPVAVGETTLRVSVNVSYAIKQ